MNAATFTTKELNNPEMPLDSGAGQIDRGSRKSSGGCTVYRPTFGPPESWQVREDGEFYIPDLLSDKHDDTNTEAYALAAEHARHLRKAQGLVGEALDLTGLMLASLGDEGDSRAMQIETALKAIEKKLKKAFNRIDRHDRRHTNLFLAYFNLRAKSEEGAE